MPSSSTSTRGAYGCRRAGRRPSNRCGGSTRWSSTEMSVHQRARRSGCGRNVARSGFAVTKKPGRRSRSSNPIATARMLRRVVGEIRLAAGRQAVAHLEAVREAEVLELADVGLERLGVAAEPGGEVGGTDAGVRGDGGEDRPRPGPVGAGGVEPVEAAVKV